MGVGDSLPNPIKQEILLATQQILGGFPTRRLRRLRKHDFSRRLVAKIL